MSHVAEHRDKLHLLTSEMSKLNPLDAVPQLLQFHTRLKEEHERKFIHDVQKDSRTQEAPQFLFAQIV